MVAAAAPAFDAALKRFYREIQAAAALNHPNIVRAYDADQNGSVHFLTMEYVKGADLSQWVKEHGPLPVADACEYMRQTALGLQHAFARGLVHRDIKPHNLLLTFSGEQAARTAPASGAPLRGTIKILDMGLALLARPEHDDKSSSTLTREGSVMGTLDYIAPEQAMDSHTVDIRADLYSLGCTFYFLLTGRVPFPGGDALAKLMKHKLDLATPLEQLRPDLPVEVAEVVRKLMAKEPSDRYQTPAEAAAALAGVMARATAGIQARGPANSWLSHEVERSPFNFDFEVPADFYLGTYEVTQEEWQRLLGKNPSHFARGGPGQEAVQSVGDDDLKRFPVDNVSWQDIENFLSRLNEKCPEKGWVYRLPTEAEWEYACRGGPATKKEDHAFDFYQGAPALALPPAAANYVQSGLKRPCKVGSYPGNRLGLCDMHGNVWEWCSDEVAPTGKVAKAPANSALRGGSFTDESWFCKATSRFVRPQTDRYPYTGLRVARGPGS